MSRPPAAERRGWRLLVRPFGAAVVVGALIAVTVLFWPVVAASGRLLRRASPEWVLAAVALQVVSMSCYAAMQRRLLAGAGTPISRRSATSMAYAAHSMSVTLPGGPLFSTAYSYRRMQLLGAESTVSAWCTAVSGMLSTVAFLALAAGIGTVATVDETDDTETLLVVLGCLALAAGVGLLLGRRPAWRERVRRGMDAVVGRLPPRGRAATRAAGVWLARLLRVRVPVLDVGVAGAMALLNWVADAVCLALCCQAMGIEVAPVNLGLTYLAGMTAASVPVVPGGVGVVDSAMTVSLFAWRVHTSAALAVVVLYRLISLVLIGVVGWLCWLLDGERILPRRGADQIEAA